MDRLEDGRTRGFWWAPNDFVDHGHLAQMGPHAAVVYIVLLRFSDRDRQAWPKIETIERLTGISRAAVFRALKQLEEHGYVSRWRDGKRNVYQILQTPTVKQVSERDVSGGYVSHRDPIGLRERPNGSQRETYGAHDSARAGREKQAQNPGRKKQIEKDLEKKTKEEEEEDVTSTHPAHETSRDTPAQPDPGAQGSHHGSAREPLAAIQTFRAAFARPEAMADRVLHDALRGAPELRAQMLAALLEADAWDGLKALRREARSARAWHDWLDQLSRVVADYDDGAERVKTAVERLALAPDVQHPFSWIISVVRDDPKSGRRVRRSGAVVAPAAASDGVDVDMRGVYIEEE